MGRGMAPARLPQQLTPQQSNNAGPGGMGGMLLKGLKLLDVVAMPGRAVVSGIREIADVMDSDNQTDASFGDFFKQIKDPTFGVGKAFKVNTGNKWVDRIIGFAGDVALDPISYMTFGAGHFAGYSGRLALAGKVLETTGDKALASKAARWGRAALEASDLERLGLNRSGVYMFGKRIKGYRIPFSETLGRNAEKSLARFRIYSSETALGQRLQGKFMNKSLHEARLRLARGLASPEEAAGIIKLLNWENVARSIKGQTVQEGMASLKRVLNEESASFESYRKSLFRVIEEQAVRNAASAEELRAAEVWSTFMKSMYDQVDALSKEIDPQLSFGFVRNGYFPRVVGESGLKYMSDPAKPYASDLAKKFARDGAIDEGGAFKTRLLKEGEEFFGYTLKQEDLTTERLNQIAREYGKIEGDFFETDLQKVMESYVNDHAQQMALLSRYKYLKDAKIIDFGDTLKWEETFVDSVAVDSATKMVEDTTKSANKAMNDGLRAVKSLVDALQKAEKEAEARVASSTKMLDGLLNDAVDAESKIAAAKKAAEELDAVRARLGQMEESIQQLFLGQKSEYHRLNNFDMLGLTADDFNVTVKQTVNGESLDVNLMDEIVKALGASSIEDPLVKSFFDVFGGNDTALDFIKKRGGVDDMPAVLGNFSERIKSTIKMIDDLNILETVNAHFAETAADALGTGLTQRQFALTDSLGKVQTELQSLQDEFNALMDGNNILNANLEKALEGKIVFTDETSIGRAVNTIRRLVGATGVDDSIRAKELFNFTYTREVMRKAIAEELRLRPNSEISQVWNRISAGGAKLVQEEVSMDFDTLTRRVNGLFGFDVSLTEAREVGSHLVMRDLMQYGSVERMPQHIRENFEEMVTLLESARTKEELIARFTEAEGSNVGYFGFVERWKQAYEQSLQQIEYHSTVLKKIDEIDQVLEGAKMGDVGLARIASTREGVDLIIGSGDVRMEASLDLFIKTNQGAIDNAKNLWQLRLSLELHAQQLNAALDEQSWISPDAIDNILGRRKKIEQLQQEVQKVEEAIANTNPVTTLITGEKVAGAIRVNENDLIELQRRLRGLDAMIAFEEDGLAKAESKGFLSPRELVNVYVKKENEYLSSGTKTRAKRATKVGRAQYYGDQTRKELTEKIVTYTMVSEIQTTMERVAHVMLPYGQVPTEKLYRDVVSRVGSKYLESSALELSQVNNVAFVIEGLRTSFRDAVSNLGKTEPGQLSAIFKDLVRKELDGPNGEALRKVLGHKFASLEDPWELLNGWNGTNTGVKGGYGSALADQTGRTHKAVKDEYIEKYLKPWWAEANPGVPFNLDRTVEALKSEVSMRQVRQGSKSVEGAVLAGEETRWSRRAAREAFSTEEYPTFTGGNFSWSEKTAAGGRGFGVEETTARGTGFSVSQRVSSKVDITNKLGPFAREAKMRNIEDFFDEILGYDKRIRGGVNANGTYDAGTIVRVPGALDNATRSAERKLRAIHSLIDPLSNINDWISNPFKRIGQPSSERYTSFLRSLADELDLQIRFLKDTAIPEAKVAADEVAQIGLEMEKIAKEAGQFPSPRRTAVPDVERELVPKTPTKWKAGDAAYEDARAAAYARQRDAAILQYNKMKSSPEYLKAQADKEIVDVLSILSGLNLHEMDGFRIVNAEEAQRLARAQADIPGEIRSLESSREQLNSRALEIRKQISDMDKLPEESYTIDVAQNRIDLQNELKDIPALIKEIDKKIELTGASLVPGNLSSFAVMRTRNADGTITEQAIRFSEEEWHSLFVHPDIYDTATKVTSRVKSTEKTETILRSTAEVRKLDAFKETQQVLQQQVAAAQSVVDEILAQIQRIDDRIARFSGPTEAKMTKIANETKSKLRSKMAPYEERLRLLQGDLVKQEVLVRNQDLLVRSLKPGTRESALEKMRILVHGDGAVQPPALTPEKAQSIVQQQLALTSGDNLPSEAMIRLREKSAREALEAERAGKPKPIMSMSEASLREQEASSNLAFARARKIVNLDPSVAEMRVKNIAESFNRTPEGQLLSRIEAMQNDYYLSDWFDFLRRRDMLQQTSERLKAVANQKELDRLGVAKFIEEKLAGVSGAKLQEIFDILVKKGYVPPETAKKILESGLSEDYVVAVGQLRTMANEVEQSVLKGPSGPVVVEDTARVTEAKGRIESRMPALKAKEGGLQEQVAEIGRQQEAMTAVESSSEANIKAVQEAQKAAREQLKQLDQIVQSAIREKIKEWKRLRVGSTKTTRGKVSTILPEVEKLAQIADDAAEQAKTSFDVLKKLDEVMNGDIPIETVIRNLDTTRKEVAKALSELPKDWRRAVKSGSPVRKSAAWEQLRMWMTTHNEIISKFKGADMADPVFKALSDVFEAEGRFAVEQALRGHASMFLSNVSEPVIRQRIMQPFEDGYIEMVNKLNNKARKAGQPLYNQGKKSLEQLGMPSLYGDSAFVTTLENIGRIQQPVVAAELSRFMFRYTRFFKAYATATPGFHLRNSISNTFQMFAAGADVAHMTSGLRLWGGFREALASTESGALKKWLESLPEEQRAAAALAQQVYFALGGGRTEEALSGFVKKGQRLTDNAVLNLSRRTGQRVEGSARFILAYDSALKGMEFNDSFARVKRFLFDYNDPSIMDEAVRGIIPFWTWMSRNLPLQLVNQFSNPKAYAVYNHFALNMAGKPIPNMPEWMQSRGAIPISGSGVLMPDMPHKSAEEFMRDIANPSRLLAMINPGIRAPFEFMTKKKFYSGGEFADKYYKLDGINSALIPFMFSTGQLKYNSKGQPVASDRAMYLASSLIPTLGQAQRLMPANEDGISGSALANWFGVPYRTVTPAMQKSEAIGQKRREQAQQTQRRNIERAQ